jgi:diguanylate cyclase (GGDEF)-like protein
VIESTPQSPTAVPLSMTPELRPYGKRQQLLQELLKDSELLLKNQLEVRHLMTRDPVVIPPTMSLDAMSTLCRHRRLHHLLVCGRGGELLGVVSDRDMHGPSSTSAQQVMSHPPLTVTSQTPLSAAITYLINENISCLPVVDHGQLCGVLTTTDLVLTLQCSLQLWLRLAQVLQHNTNWSQELDGIAAALEGDVPPEKMAEHFQQARQAIRRQVQDLVNLVDLRADMMTGMANRQGLEEILDLLLAAHKRYQQPFSLVIVAIDQFHRISETCGEEVAKSLVKALARLIQHSVRQCDFVARCREDAFAVVQMQTDFSGAETFCRRLREMAHQHTDLGIDLRIRTAVVAPMPEESANRLLHRAEAAVDRKA